MPPLHDAGTSEGPAAAHRPLPAPTVPRHLLTVDGTAALAVVRPRSPGAPPYPMVPLLADRLAARCAVLVDDANRRQEREVVERWATQLDGFHVQHLPLTRGAVLFERGR